MKSFPSYSFRIALLGLTFEFSRFITREVLRVTTSAFQRKRSDHTTEQHCEENDAAECSSYLQKIKERIQQLNPIHRYIALGSWLLLSPSILLLLNQANITTNKVSAGSTYLSSMLSSMGIILFLYPEISTKESEQNKDTRAADDPKQPSNRLLNSPDKPPLPPFPIIRKDSEEDYRPRSDSLLSQSTEYSLPQMNEKAQKQYLEVLVHNISHTDLILGLSGDKTNDDGGIDLQPRLSLDQSHTTPRSKNPPAKRDDEKPNSDQKYILCRPRFSAFDMYSRRVKTDLMQRRNSNPIISYPRYERSNATARYTLVTPRPGDQSMLPVGFNLEKNCLRASSVSDAKHDGLSINANDMTSLRVRGGDISKIDPILLGDSPRTVNALSPSPLPSVAVMAKLRINAVFFPLLSTLLPRWLGQIADKFGGSDPTNFKMGKNANVKKVVVLVSGVGSPRNWTHSISGNSTQICADLMELFIHELFPDVTVIKIHSQTNIFRYDENISFATQELMPCIDAYRDAHARSAPYPDEIQPKERIPGQLFNPDWRQTVSISYSFADGSAARTHAIQSALRPYRPTYFHFWQLKTFWHASKVTTEDIEVLSFEEIETVPAIAVDMTSGLVQKVTDEMKAFRTSFLDTLKGERSDLSTFWLRKSKKPVLAVLLVNKQNGEHVMYRGTNMEVSMPTGSLCAERNAIGTALATDPSLRREDLLMVAVLAVKLPPSPPPGSDLYCRPTNEALDLVVQVSQQLNSASFRKAEDIPRTTSISSIAEANDITGEWEMDIMSSPRRESNALHESMRPMDASSPTADDGISRSGASTPTQRISLYKFADPKSRAKLNKRGHHLGGISKNKKRLLLAQSPEDINPLKPCGACNEWLKKIAESNPHFKVLTFTDEDCRGVYVSPCQE